MPPAKASLYCGSWVQTLCSAQTSAVTGLVASFPSLLVLTPGAGYTPICEWLSIIPGVTNLPMPSITSASSTSRLAPTAFISPSEKYKS